MTRYKFIIFLAVLVSILIITGFVPSRKTQHTLRMANTDSVSFSPNSDDGWSTLSYYLHQEVDDSVDFELVIQHANNINWGEEQWIGTLSGANYIPVSEQYAAYSLLPGDNWNMHITADGKCFLNLIEGSLPPGDPIIIPLKVRYKYN